jgi:hypothetical protein
MSETTDTTAPSTPEAPAEATTPPEPRKYKVKVNGAETDVDEQELILGYQTRKAADEKFREAAAARKQAEEFVAMMKNGQFFEVAKKLGLDPRALSEKYLMEILEEESLDPKDRELKELKKQLAKTKEAEEAAQREKEEGERAALTERYTEEYTKQIVEALSSSGLPKTEHTVKRMAFYMHQGLQRGMDLSAQEVVELVRQDYLTEQQALYSSLDGDNLVKLLGEDTAKKIRQYDLAKLKGGPKLVPPAREPSTPKVVPKSTKISKEEWRERLARLKEEE